MATNRKAKKDDLQITGNLLNSMNTQLEVLELLIYRKFLASLSPEQREMMDVHLMLLDAMDDLNPGSKKTVTVETLQPIIVQAELILTGFKS